MTNQRTRVQRAIIASEPGNGQSQANRNGEQRTIAMEK